MSTLLVLSHFMRSCVVRHKAHCVFMVTGLIFCVPAVAQLDAAEANDKARAGYQAFLSLASTDDPRRPAALRRLADMEVERAEQLLIDGGRDEQATSVYAKAIKLYRDLLTFYPDYEQNDAVHYQLARALEAINDTDAARQVLTELVEQKPNSSFAEESEFRRGETLFSNAEYNQAASAYAAVIARGEAASSGGEFFEQALYKHGWSEFKLANYPASQQSFLKLLRRQVAPTGQFDANLLKMMGPGSGEMLTDALRAMSLGFSYGDGPDDIHALLERESAPGFEHLLYQDLGELYRKEERFHDAAQAYRAFVAQNPNAKHAPHMQLEVIETYGEAGFGEQELNAKEAFAREYALNQPAPNYWSQHGEAGASDIIAALKSHLTELTQLYHAQAQASTRLNPEARLAVYRQAVSWYRAWLDSFPAAPETARTHFLLAELLFDQGAYDQAVAAYEYTAYQYDRHEQSAVAGYAALLAYEKQALTYAPKSTAGRKWEEQSIQSALKFSATFKDHTQATSVQTHAAERLFARGDLDAALLAATSLLQWQPTASRLQQRSAWLVKGHAYFDLEKYAEAESAYQKTLAISAAQSSLVKVPEAQLLDAQLKADDAIIERLAASIYKQAEAEQLNGRLQQAAEHFLRLAQIAPSSSLVATAQYDAASALMDLKNYPKAAKVLQAFRTSYPTHELQNEVTRNLSVSYLESGDTTRAADELMRLAKSSSNAMEVRLQASAQAIDIYRQSGTLPLFVESYVYSIQNLRLSIDEHIDAREEIASAYQKMGNESQHSKWVRAIIETHQRAGDAATLRSQTAAASAALMFAQREWQPFVEIRLTVPLQQSLQLKKHHMERVLEQFGQAASFNIAEVSTAATFRIAAAYAEMANALLTSERPGGLNADELEQYEFLLEEQAFPFEEQAIEVHENNVARVSDGLYDTWIRKSFNALAELMPGRYQKNEKGVSIAELLD